MAFTKNPNTHQGAYALTLRKRAGAYLKGLRQDQKLTQSDMAKLLGIEYYTFVSQVETGLVRVPPEQLERWALCEELNRRYATSGKSHVLELGETDLGDPIAVIIDTTNPDAAIAFAREGGRYFMSPWGSRTTHARSLRSLCTRILGRDLRVPEYMMKAMRNGGPNG